MKEATSCGGVVIHKGKILLLYKNFYNHYHGWVLPKGTVEEGESFEDTALREVYEEGSSIAKIIEPVGETHYVFNGNDDEVNKTVHWYLMSSNAFYSRPQKEEYFEDSGFYKYHEAIFLLKYPNEKEILEKAYAEYKRLKSVGKWYER